MFTSSIHRSFFSKTFLFLVICFWTLSARAVFAEQITSFNSDIEVQPNGDFIVTETIAYDFGTVSRHGIFRKVKDKHPQSASSWLKTRYLDPELVSVKRDGQTEQYSTERSYRGFSIKIGSPYRTITGEHIYEIQYVVKGGLAVYDGQPEVYWNVTGDEWEVSMQKVTATIRAASGVTFGAEHDCYIGEAGSAERCITNVLGPTAIQFSTTNVFPGSQLTVAQQVNVQEEPVVLERWNLIPLALGGGLIWLFGIAIAVYRWRFQYRTGAPIIAQYEPYADFKPMFTGVLFDGRLDSRDITAGIVYLAEQGFVKIVETEQKLIFGLTAQDYEVKLLRPADEATTEIQGSLLKLLFSNPHQTGMTTRLSSIKQNQLKLRENFMLIQKLKRAVKRDMKQYAFIDSGFSMYRSGLGVGVLVLLIIIPVAFVFSPPLGIIMALFLVCTVVILVFAYDRRTRKGFEALDYLKGFKDFLATTEKDRYKFHNAPEKSPEQFMEFLPYAIAFGVEKEWAEVFKDIQIGTPEWYESHSGAAFNAAAFASDLGTFSSNLASSGTSSGGSGSSGGGSSGGGGGGGGGGSW